MTLKRKLTLGLVLLFGLLVLVSSLGMFSINALAGDAGEILKDNYNSLDYVQRMQHALENRVSDPVNRQVFIENLQKQQQNITEPSEQRATEALTEYWARLDKNPADSLAQQAIQANLLAIADANLQAIALKNDQALATAEKAVTWLGIIVTLCLLIGFSFLINFPAYIADPIRELTAGIRAIAQGNYAERLRLDRRDEFGELSTAFNELAAKLDAYEHSNLARLLFEKKRLETVLGVLHDPVIGLDENRQVLFANAPALALLNLPANKLIGRDAREVALTNDLLRSLLARSAQSATVEPLKIFADGKESFFQPETLDISAATAQPGGTVQAIGQVLLLKNITPFRERDLAKTNFIATISHELKTPLSAMQLGLSLLDDERVGALNTEQHQLLAQLRNDANRLLSITGELLKLAQAETGQIQLALAPSDPHQIVETARQALAAQAQEKNIRLEITALPDSGTLVLADPDKAAWILVNLLSNAVRHSPEDQLVGISVVPEGDFLRFAVRDHGPGVPAALQEKIFEHYFRAPGAPSGGTGLGLAISREFVQAMGGEIGVESSSGQGSTFWFTLRSQAI